MKKVLFIAPLEHSTPRIPGLSTYLPKYGWHPTILTTSLERGKRLLRGMPEEFFDSVKIVEADFRGDVFWFWRLVLKKLGFKEEESLTEQLKSVVTDKGADPIIDRLMFWYQTFFAFPDTERTWRRPALKIARDVLRKGDFDIIVSSSPFPTNHCIANALKKEFNIPWIADYRDPWTNNHAFQFPKFRQFFEVPFERSIISLSDMIVTVSTDVAGLLKQLHNKDIQIIPNGFFINELNMQSVLLTEKMTITYTGKIYPQQDFKKFLDALAMLVKYPDVDSEKIEVRLYGQKLAWIERAVKELGLVGIVKQYGFISRDEVIKRQRESHILLLLGWEEAGNAGMTFTKFYEYLAAKRPILISGGEKDSLCVSILKEIGAGFFASTVTEIENILLHCYDLFKKSGAIHYEGDDKKLYKYSFESRAKTYASLFKQIINP